MIGVSVPLRGGSRRSAARPRVRAVVRWLRTVVYFGALLALAVWTIERVVGDAAEVDRLIVATFVAGGIVSALGLTSACARDGMSLAAMFWFFNFFFFCLAPLVQYLSGIWQFPISERSMAVVNVLLFGYYAAFALMYRAVRPASASLPRSSAMVAISRKRLRLLVVVAGALVVALAVKSGFVLSHSMLLTAVAAPGELPAATPVATLIDAIVRPSVFFLFLFALLLLRAKRRRSGGDVILALLAGIAALLFNAPTSAARFYVFTLYFGLLMVVYKPSPRRSGIYLGALTGALFASSFAHVVRSAVFRHGDAPPADAAEASSLRNLFFAGHFDAYENVVHTLEFIRSDGIVWGRQLLGPLFFWVPRSIWPTKPIGTGAFVATEFLARENSLAHTNLSAPMVEEALINFGIPGVLLCGLFAGWAFGWLDGRHQLHRRYEESGTIAPRAMPASTPFFLLFYPLLVAFSLFFQRGDALSATAYGTAIFFGFLIVQKLIVVRVRRRGAARIQNGTLTHE